MEDGKSESRLVMRRIGVAPLGDTAGELSEAISRPGGATDISRWRSPSAATGNLTTEPRALKGRRTLVVSVENSGPASLPGREKSLLVCPGACARAPAPANVPRASGAEGVCQQYLTAKALQRLSPILDV